MRGPQLIINAFHSEESELSNHINRLRDVDVPVPVTKVISHENINDSVELISNFMNRNDFSRVFLRSSRKAATKNIVEGSMIQSNEDSEIRSTIRSLQNQHTQSHIPPIDTLIVREWLDLNFCMNANHLCHPEERYFIEDGDILCSTPKASSWEYFVCDRNYSYISDEIDKYEPPDQLAKRIAQEYTEKTWSVDFVLTTNGEWYCTEVHLNSVYWSKRKGYWHNSVGQGFCSTFSPLFVHEAALRHGLEEMKSNTDSPTYYEP